MNSEVITKGHGRLVSAASFDIINRFFQGIDYQGNKIDYSKYINANGEVELTHIQLSELIYPSDGYNSKREGVFHLSNYKTNIFSADYAKRSLAFGSSTFSIDTDNIRYHIQNGRAFGVKNFKITPQKDNYDYESINVNQSLNNLLKSVLSQGKNSKVDIYYIEDRKNPYENISHIQFNNLKRKHSENVEKYEIRNVPSFALRYLGAILPRSIPDFKIVPWDKNYTGIPRNQFSLATSSNIPEEKAKNNFYHSALTNKIFIGFDHHALNQSTKTKDLASAAIVTDDMQPDRMNRYQYTAIDASSISNQKLNSATRINRAQGKSFKTPVDPLILDLNGDGVKTVSYTEKPVLFDIDNDGGSLEETGWLSHQDGLLVRDLNNNGKIDNMAEVFSEYYAGRAGQNGEAGEKRFKNGFDALKTLDSNNDNIFDSKDRNFSKVRVWQDANHNGITDSGELKTLSSLGITAIELGYQNMGGQLFGGNELLAKGYFTRNGKKQEAAAVNFLANPRGHTITNVSGGKKTITEAAGVLEQTSSYTASDNRSRVLRAATLGVANIQAGDGNDTLHGDAQDNWLAGGGGSDTFFGGEGDDVLLIDGDDLPENIHGGAGDDIVQVIGDKGISLDLAAAEVEIAHGGRGDDVFVSSGNSSIFVRGGDGNDTIVGSIANDALSGENGDDFISGNAGKDLIRGHRGNDRLFGDEGDDVLFGGSDDDMLYGGEGNDTLLGEGGDDYLDGGEGEDVAEFSGNFADYKITKMGDGVLVSDRTQGRDGTDFLPQY